MFLCSFLVPSVPPRVAVAMLAVCPPGCALCLSTCKGVLMSSGAAELLKEGGCYDSDGSDHKNYKTSGWMLL